jgi:hypothetical protein
MTTDTNKPTTNNPATNNPATNHKDDRTQRTGANTPQVLAGRPGEDPTVRPEVTTGPRDEGTRIFPTASESDGPREGRDKSNDVMRFVDAIQENVSRMRKALRASGPAAAGDAMERKSSERNPSAETEVREPAVALKTV